MVSTSSIKNLQETGKCPFQTLKIFVFEIKVVSKSFSKKLPRTKFEFKLFWRLCLPFPENSLNFVTQKLEKNWKIPFSNAQNIRFWAQGSFKTIFLRSFQWPNFDLNRCWCFVSLSQKMVSTLSLKNCKNLKISFSKCTEHSFLISRSLQNQFLKIFLWPTLNLSDLECFVSITKKLKNTLFKHSEHSLLSSR